MFKLFKNATKSFMQSKVAMILLSFLIFISSSVFTMLNASSIAFHTGYDVVMKEGNVHDFTIKQKWKISGVNTLTVKASSLPDEVSPILDTNNPLITNVGKVQEIYMDALDSTVLELDQTQKFKTPSYKIDLSHALVQYTDATHTKIKINGSVNVFLNTKGEADFTGSSATDAKNDDELNWTTPIIINQDTIANTKTTVKWSKYDWGTLVGDVQADVTIKLGGIQFLSLLETKLQNYFISRTFKRFEIDDSALTGIYKKQNFDWAKISDSIYPFLADSSLADPSKDPRMLASLDMVMHNITKLVNNGLTNLYIQKVSKLVLDNNEEISKYLFKPSSIQSLFVTSKTEQFKVVSAHFENRDVDKTVIFSGQKPSYKYSDSEMFKGLDSFWSKLKNPLGKIMDNTQKNFKWTRTSSFLGNPTASVAFTNFQSLQSVVSSSYVNANKKQIMTIKDLQNFRNDYVHGEPLQNLFNKYKKQHKVVTVDNTDFLISGIGTSPDFAFPIINHKNPLPNPQNQAIIFTSHMGYSRIKDAFRSNETENYIAFKFHNNTPEIIQAKILELIKQDAQARMSWPPSISPLTMRNDINERVILAPQRISFLSKIQTSITSISYLTTSLLSLLTIFIIIMVVSKQINSKRKILGTLLANGYSKNQIALSMMSIAFVIITLPASLGYLSGYFIQTLFISIFNNYWTLPITFTPFSFITMSITIMLPMIITMLITYIFTRIELRGNLLNIIKESSSRTEGWITSRILGKLKFVNIKNKITISLFTSNISKMVMVTTTSTIALIAGSVAFSIMGKFKYAAEKSSIPINYAYKIDLATPTNINNSYKLSDLSSYGLDGTTWDKTIDPADMFRDPIQTKQSSKPYFHWIKDAIAEGQEAKTVNYLKNKIQIKDLLDMKIGAVGVSANPWAIAKAAMPENQLNQSIYQDSLFNFYSVKWLKNYANLSWYKKLKASDKQQVKIKLETIFAKTWFKDITQPGNVDHTINNPSTGTITQDFKDFIFFAIKTQICRRIEKKENYLPFMISYGNIIKDSDDEVYSQLAFDYNGRTHLGPSLVSSRIIGLNETKNSMVSINSQSINALKAFKMDNIDIVDRKEDAIPIIINEYFKEVYSVGVGDIISIDITNHKDKNNATISHKTNAKIIGVDETYNGIKIYSLQKFVNNKLGYSSVQGAEPIFNGIFTKQSKNPLIFEGVNLYSESNFYIGSSSISETDAVWSEMKKIIDAGGPAWTNNSVTDFQSYLAAYSSTPYVLSMSNASWVAMSEFAFKSTLSLTNKMIWMIEGISILISILFIAIIASMVINDNKRFIATAKTLGYRNREIKRMFFRSLSPALFLAICITIPIMYGTLLSIKYIIMSFGSILVPITIIWWTIPLALGLLVIMFSTIYTIAMSKFKNEQMLEAFKI